MRQILLDPVRFWRCASCGLTEHAQVAAGQARMHPCPALEGLTVPLEPVSNPDSKPISRHVAVMAEDYIGDRSNPVVAVRTDRPDGSNDLNVFPGPAVGTIS
jgi:hypothetical protein